MNAVRGMQPRRQRQSRRWRLRRNPTVALLVIAAAAALGLVVPASADYTKPPRTTTWSPTNGRVYAMERIGDTIYIGGSFTRLRHPSGSGGADRNRLAAFDANTGALRPWNPGANGEIRALHAASDGNLFVGGRYTAIAGTARSRLVKLDPDTGSLVAGFTPNVSGDVWALERIGERLFLGGAFGSVGGQTHRNVAAVDDSTGTPVAGWNGSANARVQALKASPNGDRVFIGGRFNGLSGQSRDFIGAFTFNGAVSSWRPQAPCRDVQNLCYLFDIAVDVGRVYVAVGGPGGQVRAYDLANASSQWHIFGDGDVQAVAVHDGTVYGGGHFEVFGSQNRAGIVALNSTTGGVLGFNPRITDGLGVWDIIADDASLRLGGGFRFIDGSSARVRYAEFPAVPAPADDTPPSVPDNLRAADVSDTIASLRWDASSDDTAVAGYRLWRDGQERVTLGVTSYSDRDLDPSTSYTYRVQAVDHAGNWSALSDPLQVSTEPPSTSLVKTGSTWNYLSNGSDQGTAWRAPAFNDNSWSSDDAQLGYGDADETTVISPLGLTHYFRQDFQVADASAIQALAVRLLRDDGAVIYINGVEVWRSNMPAGAVDFDTPASTEVTGTAEDVFHSQQIPHDALRDGSNTIAVEVHNRVGSTDVSFDLELVPTFN